MTKKSARKARRKASARSSKAATTELDLGSDKLYFKIGEVSEIVGVPPYVLRYWESEFRAVKPQKSRSQQRVYRRRDVETLLKIKHLLYDRKFTIAGARQQLREAPEGCEPATPSGAYLARLSLGMVRGALDELRQLVEQGAGESVAADPAAYVADLGGVTVLFDQTSGHERSPQPLLVRPERS